MWRAVLDCSDGSSTPNWNLDRGGRTYQLRFRYSKPTPCGRTPGFQSGSLYLGILVFPGLSEIWYNKIWQTILAKIYVYQGLASERDSYLKLREASEDFRILFRFPIFSWIRCKHSLAATNSLLRNFFSTVSFRLLTTLFIQSYT